MQGTVLVQGCAALNSASSPRNEGLGGAIHVSAGGILYANAAGGLILSNNTAATSGGGLSVKSGDAYLGETVVIVTNAATGTAASGYGNGGGIFVTTSYYDDSPIPNPLEAAGYWAATIWGHGVLESENASLSIRGNSANRWGGGLFVGLSPPWYGSGLNNLAACRVTIQTSDIANNTAGTAATATSLLPALATLEHVETGPVALDGSSFSGNPATDIGVYELSSVGATTNNCTFTNLAVEVLTQ